MLECKSGKSRYTQTNRKCWPWNTEQNKVKANRVLSRKYADHRKHPFSNNPRDDLRHRHHWMIDTEIRLVMFLQSKKDNLYSHKNKTRSWLDGLTDSTDMSLSKLQEIVKQRDAWHAAVIQDFRIHPLGWNGWISLQSKGLSKAFSHTTVQKHQFFGAQLSSYSNSHIHTWPLEKP